MVLQLRSVILRSFYTPPEWLLIVKWNQKVLDHIEQAGAHLLSKCLQTP